jgi:Predicted integral membrane protein (DUF2269)
MTTSAASAYEVVMAIHIVAVIVAFGVTFAYPIMFAVAARQDLRSLPLLYRLEYSIERWLVNPGLLVVLLAGVYLASDGHHWSEFFVQWGVAAVVVIGAVVGAVMIPTAKRAEQAAERDLAAVGDGPLVLGEESQRLARRLSVVGTLLSLLVVATVFVMVMKP